MPKRVVKSSISTYVCIVFFLHKFRVNILNLSEFLLSMLNCLFLESVCHLYILIRKLIVLMKFYFNLENGFNSRMTLYSYGDVKCKLMSCVNKIDLQNFIFGKGLGEQEDRENKKVAGPGQVRYRTEERSVIVVFGGHGLLGGQGGLLGVGGVLWRALELVGTDIPQCYLEHYYDIGFF